MRRIHMCYGMHCEWENSWGECRKPNYLPCPVELSELEGQETEALDEGDEEDD